MTKEQLKIKEQIETLARKADRRGIEKLEADEQVAVLVLWAYGAISNGGFRAFYRGPAKLEDLVRALRLLGLDAQAEAAAANAQFFPDPTLANADPETRMQYRDSLETDAQDDVFFALPWEALYDAIGKYLNGKPN